MKRSSIFLFLILVMAAVGGYKYYLSTKNNVNVDNGSVAKTDVNENSAIIETDEGVGLSEEAKKGLVSAITENPIPEDVPESSDSMLEEIITVSGPNTLPKEECMSRYKKAIPDVVRFARTDAITDYFKCHAIAEDNINYCDRDNCQENEILEAQHVYNVLSGKLHNYSICEQRFKKVSIPGLTPRGLCDLVEDIIARKKPIPAQGTEAFAYVSGRTASCSVVKRPDQKAQCVLMADLISGLRTGVSKYYLYDALKLQSCQKVDHDLLERYCTNKLPSKEDVVKNSPNKAKKRSSRKQNY